MGFNAMCQPKQIKNRVLSAIYDAKKPLCFSEIKTHTDVNHICIALRNLQAEKLIRARMADKHKWYELTSYSEEAAK
ncbi:hypothetical protein U3A91_000396 [Cronobacter sakazakii]|nr:hypothetical protein [Cronobacter sakazakii]